MKYLVMECHPGYAVVLSQDGRFIKTANLNYDVGETVCDIIIMDSKPQNRLHWLFISIAAALCAALVALAVWYYALVRKPRKLHSLRGFSIANKKVSYPDRKLIRNLKFWR